MSAGHAFLKWLGKIIGTALTLCLMIVLLPYAFKAAYRLLPDGSKNAVTVSAILSRKMEESARLETNKISDEGVISSSVNALWIGEVQNVVMKYTYEASLGIDLKKVEMSIAGNTLTLKLPKLEILTDSINIKEVERNDFWFPLSESRRRKLMEDEKLKCRQHYLEENEDSVQARVNTEKVVREMLAELLSGSAGMDVDIQIEFQTDEAA